MSVTITGCHHVVDFETLEESVFLRVQVGELEAEVETTEAGLQAVLALVGQTRLEPAVQEARAQAEQTMADLEAKESEEAEGIKEFDRDGVIPFGLGGADG